MIVRHLTNPSTATEELDRRPPERLRALVAAGLVEYVRPSPAGPPMFWYTTPSAGLSLRRHGNPWTAGPEGSSREPDGVDP